MNPHGIEIARRVLERHRPMADAKSEHLVTLPVGAYQELCQALAAAVESELQQITSISSDGMDPHSFEFEFWREVARTGVPIQRVYVVPHLGFAREPLAEALRVDSEFGVQSYIAPLSKLPQDISVGALWNTTIVDQAFVAFRMDPGRENARITATVRPQDLRTAQNVWTALMAAKSDVPAGVLDLEEPLALSADLLAEVADVLCTGDHVDHSNCSWYHGVWQHLRLLDLVSTPSWHHEFYLSTLTDAFARGASRVLISGTADYSMLAYVLHAASMANKEPAVTVLDRCPTPLFAARWYSRKLGCSIETVQADLFDWVANSAAFDLICTDAFLTRFERDTALTVLEKWRSLLSPSGSVVTTVRVHSMTDVLRSDQEALETFRERTEHRISRWAPFLRTPPRTIIDRAIRYASTMNSNPLGMDPEIRAMFESVGLDVFSAELSQVPGELFSTVYLRCCARVS